MSAERLPVIPFGLRKSQVREHLRVMQELQGLEIDELRKRVNKARKERLRLRVQMQMQVPAPETSLHKQDKNEEQEPVEMNTTKEPVEMNTIEESVESDQGVPPQRAAEPSAPENNLHKKNMQTSPFWGGADETVRLWLMSQIEAQRVSGNSVGETKLAVEAEGQTAIRTDRLESAVATAPLAKPTAPLAKPIVLPATSEKSAEELQDEVAKAEGESGQLHVTVSPPAIGKEEIEAISRRYIIGKLAGSDLLAPDATLIIRKGAAITETVVKQAQAAGKLAELIVHMQLPQLGES